MRISAEALSAIRSAVRQSGNIEACGLLFGSADEIRTASIARNISDQPRHRFEIDPAHLFDAQRRDRAGPDRLIGCWHSHPDGKAAPSALDRAGVADMHWLWLIATADDLTCWQPTADGFAPVALRGSAL